METTNPTPSPDPTVVLLRAIHAGHVLPRQTGGGVRFLLLTDRQPTPQDVTGRVRSLIRERLVFCAAWSAVRGAARLTVTDHGARYAGITLHV